MCYGIIKMSKTIDNPIKQFYHELNQVREILESEIDLDNIPDENLKGISGHINKATISFFAYDINGEAHLSMDTVRNHAQWLLTALKARNGQNGHNKMSIDEFTQGNPPEKLYGSLDYLKKQYGHLFISK